MADTVLEVGAVIDLSQILPGMEKMATSTAGAVSQMTRSFSSLPVVAGPSIAELNASIERLITSNLAVAESSAAMAGAVMGSMTKTTAAVAAGSTGAIASLENLKREMATVAGSAEISARGTMAAFGPLGMLFGVGIAAHYAEGLKDVILQLDRMSASSGVSVSQLAQFKGALESMGVPSENMSRLFLHMTMQMKAAHDGVAGSVNAFKQLGISTEEWSKTMPNALELLLKMSDYMHVHKDTMDVTGAAAKILGARLGVELVGAMSQGSETLKKYMAQHKELGDQMQAAVMDARRLQEAEAEASAAIKSAMVPLIGFMADFLNVAHALWLGLKYDVLDAFAGIKLGVEDTILAFQTFGKVMYDLARVDWSAAKADSKAYFDAAAKNAADAAAKIAEHNKEIAEAGFKVSEKPKPPVPGTEEPDVIAKAKRDSMARVEAWRDALSTMKADADNFHAVTAADEVAYWEKILAAEKLSAKERLAVHRELNHAKHAAALEAYQQEIALDQEFIGATKEGSAERLAAVMKERDDVVAAYGASSRQADAANKAVLAEMAKGDLLAAENVAKSVAQQTALYKAGATQRIEITARAIAALKVMQDNLAAGRTAAGAPEPAAPVGPTAEADARLRVLARQNESAEIQKVVDELTGRLMGYYKADAAEAVKSSTAATNARIASIMRIGRAEEEGIGIARRSTAEITREAYDLAAAEIGAIKQSSDEKIRQIDRLHGYDLITFSEKVALSRGVLDEEERAATAEIALRMDLIKAEEQRKVASINASKEMLAAKIGVLAADQAMETAITLAATDANAKIAALQKQLADIYERLAMRRQVVSDQATNHEIESAQRAGAIIGGSFQSTIDRMMHERLSFSEAMRSFWNDMVAGFARMGAQIIANWIKTLTTKLLLNVLHLGQTQALETAETTAHLAHVETRAASTAAGQAQETGATAAGAGARGALGILEAIGSIARAAAVAAAHAFKSVMEALPFPINVGVAAGVAAGAFLAVKAFAGKLSSAAAGMVADEDQLVQVHAQETILPANLSRGFQNIITAGAFQAPLALAQSFSPAASGGSPASSSRTVHQRNEYNLYHHGPDAQEVLETQLVPLIRRAQRRGELETL